MADIWKRYCLAFSACFIAAALVAIYCFIGTMAPIADERVNIAEIWQFARGNYTPVDYISSSPAYHYVMAFYARLFHVSNIARLRVFSFAISSLCIPVFYVLARRNDTRPEACLRSLQFAAVPFVLLYAPLLYCDGWGLLFFLLSLHSAMKGQVKLSAFWGFLSVCIKQFNIIWIGLAWLFLVSQETSLSEWRFELIKKRVKANWPFLLVFAAFCAFVAWNGAVAMGDKKYQELTLGNVSNDYYFLLSGCLVFLPLSMYVAWQRFSSAELLSVKYLGALTLLFLVYMGTYYPHHFYNQAETFPLYVHNKMLYYTTHIIWLKALTFFPIVCFLWVISQAQFSQKRFLWWYPVTIYSLALFPLIENRYYIIPITFFMLYRRLAPAWVEWSLLPVFIGISAAFFHAMPGYAYFP